MGGREDRDTRRRRRHWASVPVGILLGAGLLACGQQVAQEERQIEGERRPERVDAARFSRQQTDAVGLNAGAAVGKQILFGDLHVHTTFSQDAYLFSLPVLGGDGVHPPADACDFARYCANLDFFALTDHAESLSPEHYALSKQSIRECNARAGDPGNPDLVAFMGFEWTQMGLTPETHWGHRCVIFPDTAESSLPPRPIASADKRAGVLATANAMSRLKWLDPLNWARYGDYVAYAEALQGDPLCDEGSAPGDPHCLDVAATPAELHRKLDAFGLEALDIPHGTAWGVYTPATTTIDKHLDPDQYDPQKMKLVEIMSGHGNSEEFRSWREFEIDDAGQRICPEPTADYLPCCWQAGEIMRSRCGDLEADECERRVELARSYGTEAWTNPTRIFPDAAPEEWLDCGQCRDCFKPSFSLRPRESVQYGMSLAREDVLDDAGRPLRFRYGFVASSDEHSGRPGVGYKSVDRGLMTDVNDAGGAAVGFLMGGPSTEDPRMPIRPAATGGGVRGNDGRTQAFLYPGGLAAVHARSRSREDVWDAMQRKEVYGTSGPRILLWFDLLNGPGGSRHPMGSEVELAGAPRFEVRALGSFEPRPGCPDWSGEGLSGARIAELCHDECYFPSDVRRPIVAIEVVRIRTRVREGESVDPLIEDPWRRFECAPRYEGCVVEFEDEDFSDGGRDTLYYVRALEAARPAIVGKPLRPKRSADGSVVSVELCETGDDCLDETSERAWSSPIFIDHPTTRSRPKRREFGVEPGSAEAARLESPGIQRS